MQRVDTDMASAGAAPVLRPHPAPLRASATVQRQRLALARALHTQFVSRLAVACAPVHAAPAQPRAGSNAAIAHLVALAMGDNDSAVRRHLPTLLPHMALPDICLQILEPAARRLGEMWEDDLCSFTDVTIGVMRLHDGLHALTRAAREGMAATCDSMAILLAAAPGDPHTFGLTMVGALFEQAGWRVGMIHQGTVEELCGLLRRDWYGVLGFSVSADRYLNAVARALPRLRSASRNPSLAVMVGGPVFAARPELAAQIGADGTATDGVQATCVAENLLSSLQGGRPGLR